ncbi:MAG: PAS domain S-box protein [Anaerolineales bacterium]|nr:PAS domain S-box protein [Anaerolineales bacterium]
MYSFLPSWLSPPVFEEDENKTNRARLLNTILIALFTIAFLYLVFAPLEATLWQQRLTIIVPFLIAVLILWLVMRRGYIRFTGHALVFFMWVMFTVAMGYGRGYNNPAYMGYVIVVVCAGLLLGQRATIFWAGISILTSLLIVKVAVSGLFPEASPPPTPLAFFFAQSMYILVTAVLLNLALGIIRDSMAHAHQELAERMRVEEALRASETRLRTVLENLGEGVCVQDHQWVYTYANPAAHSILGWPPGLLVGKSEDEILPPSGFALVKQENLQRRAGKITTYETEILRPGGELRTILATGVPSLDEQGKLLETFVVFIDITERKLLDKELQDERDFILQIIETMGQGLTVIDEADRLILVNPAFLSMTGYTAEEIIGKRPVDFTATTAHSELLQARAERKQGKVTTYESVLQGKNTQVTPVLITGAPRWKNGAYAGAISVITDLTPIKQHEENLRTTANELKERNASLQIVNELAFQLHLSRSAQQIAERAVYALQTYSQSPLIAFYLLDAGAQRLKLLASFGFDPLTVEAGQTLPVEGSLSGVAIQQQTIITSEDLAHDGRVFPLVKEGLLRQGLHSVISIPLLFQQDVLGVINLIFREPYPLNASQRETLIAIGNTVGLAIANVNHLAQAQNEAVERRRVEEEIRQLNAVLEQRVLDRTTQLEEVNRELESFAYSVSHDLRTPLRAVEGFVTVLLEQKSASLDEEGQHYLIRVVENSRRMSQLIEDLLTFSRLGRQPLQKHHVAPTEILAQILEDLHPELIARQVELSIAPTLPMCEADPALLRQVYTNLLSNALKYSRPRPVAKIEVSWINLDEEIVYFVRDNGVGFDMRYADKLFGVFQRLHRQEEFEGTGVGLANVHRIIHRHGGRIWAEAAVNQGATFYFTLGNLHGA